MDIINIEAWRGIVTSSLTTLWTKIASFAPNLIGAILILIIGYFVSKILAKLGQSILVKLGFDKLCQRTGIQDTLTSSGINKPVSYIIGIIIFWLIMMMFLISVSETMGLDTVAQTVESFVLYLPNVIGAVIIFAIGAAISGFVRDLVNNGASRLGMDYSKALSTTVYGVLIVVASILAIDQLRIDTSFLANAIQILLLAAGAGLAITLGFGTRHISQHLISGIYAREIYNSGDHIQMGDIDGVVEQVGTVSTLITTNNGHKVQIPNHKLINVAVTKLS